MIRREPFVTNIGVGQLDLIVSHRVVKENLDLHFGVIDHRARPFFHGDPQHQVGFGIRVRCFGSGHFSNAKCRTRWDSLARSANASCIKRGRRFSGIKRGTGSRIWGCRDAGFQFHVRQFVKRSGGRTDLLNSFPGIGRSIEILDRFVNHRHLGKHSGVFRIALGCILQSGERAHGVAAFFSGIRLLQ